MFICTKCRLFYEGYSGSCLLVSGLILRLLVSASEWCLLFLGKRWTCLRMEALVKLVINSVLEFAGFCDFWRAYSRTFCRCYSSSIHMPRTHASKVVEGGRRYSSSVHLGPSVSTVTLPMPTGVAFCSGAPSKRHINERTSGCPHYT